MRLRLTLWLRRMAILINKLFFPVKFQEDLLSAFGVDVALVSEHDELEDVLLMHLHLVFNSGLTI